MSIIIIIFLNNWKAELINLKIRLHAKCHLLKHVAKSLFKTIIQDFLLQNILNALEHYWQEMQNYSTLYQ